MQPLNWVWVAEDVLFLFIFIFFYSKYYDKNCLGLFMQGFINHFHIHSHLNVYVQNYRSVSVDEQITFPQMLFIIITNKVQLSCLLVEILFMYIKALDIMNSRETEIQTIIIHIYGF